VRCGGASGSAVLVRSSCAAEAPDVNRKGKQPPNKRLKLAGGDRFEGSGVFAPGWARSVVHHPCAGGRVARSLSAIR